MFLKKFLRNPRPIMQGDPMFIELLRSRRSIRRFQEKPIEPEKRALLEEAALRSPSSRDLNPWEFIFIDDRETLEKLSRSKPHGAGFLQKAALAVCVIADPEKCDIWIEDCSIASVFIHLAAHSMGLGSCWIQIRKRAYNGSNSSESYVRGVLGVPEKYTVLSLVAVGYPAEHPEGHPQTGLPCDKLFINRYGSTKK